MTNILVIGGTGEVGREVIHALLQQKQEVRALVRSRERGDLLPGAVESVVGDLADKTSLEAALSGITAVFFITPHHPDEETLGRNVIDACEQAGVQRLVFSSAFCPDSSHPWVRRLLLKLMGWFTHYLPKLMVDEAVRQSSIDSVVLMPSNFYQNDALFKKEILAGSYPQPLGQKAVSRVDCRDIGLAAARGLTGKLAPGAYSLVAAPLTGPDCAAIWTEQLGKQVTYAGDDIEQWRKTVGERMYLRKRDDFAKTYGVMQRFGAAISKKDIALAETAVGRPLITYREYVADCINQWRQ